MGIADERGVVDAAETPMGVTSVMLLRVMVHDDESAVPAPLLGGKVEMNARDCGKRVTIELVTGRSVKEDEETLVMRASSLLCTASLIC